MTTQTIQQLVAFAATLVFASHASFAAEQKESKDVSDTGIHLNAKGEPTYKIDSDGKVDWATYNGYRRFNSNCETCHGPDGSGSSFAPDLTDSLKNLSYDQFSKVVVNGRKNVSVSQTSVMPAFGENKNVMCYLDDIYVYLKARSDGKLGRGRPADHAPKSKAAAAAETECMGF